MEDSPKEFLGAFKTDGSDRGAGILNQNGRSHVHQIFGVADGETIDE